MRIAAVIPVALLVALVAAPARAQQCTDASCQIDLSVDECADPAAGCLPERALDDDALARAELAPLPEDEAIAPAAAMPATATNVHSPLRSPMAYSGQGFG